MEESEKKEKKIGDDKATTFKTNLSPYKIKPYTPGLGVKLSWDEDDEDDDEAEQSDDEEEDEDEDDINVESDQEAVRHVKTIMEMEQQLEKLCITSLSKLQRQLEILNRFPTELSKYVSIKSEADSISDCLTQMRRHSQQLNLVCGTMKVDPASYLREEGCISQFDKKTASLVYPFPSEYTDVLTVLNLFYKENFKKYQGKRSFTVREGKELLFLIYSFEGHGTNVPWKGLLALRGLLEEKLEAHRKKKAVLAGAESKPSDSISSFSQAESSQIPEDTKLFVDKKEATSQAALLDKYGLRTVSNEPQQKLESNDMNPSITNTIG